MASIPRRVSPALERAGDPIPLTTPVPDRAAAAPLPTNWMDRVLMAQTYAGRPMTTHHVLETESPFDRGRLISAVDRLVRAVPTLRSVIRERWTGIDRIATSERRMSSWVTYRDTPVDLSRTGWLARPFALELEEPFRVLHSPRLGGGYQLVLTLHHGLTDGIGAVGLFETLLGFYDGRGEENLDGAPEPDASFGGLLKQRPGLVPSVLGANLMRTGRFADRRASLLEDAPAPADGLRCAVLEVTPARWARLRRRAVELGCTRNDLLLVAFLRSGLAWRRERRLEDEDFRALVPADLRRHFGINPSLSNHLGVIEADFAVGEIDDHRLPEIVRRRLEKERSLPRLLATPFLLAFLDALLPPAALRRFFRWIDERPSAFMYSFLFSHIRLAEELRVPASVGTARLYCLSALPRQPGVGLTITARPGGVTAALAYSPPRLSDQGAEALMSHFARALEGV